MIEFDDGAGADPTGQANNNNILEEILPEKESFIAEAHKLLLFLKNKRQSVESEAEKNTSLVGPILGFFQIFLDWIVDLIVAGSHFYNGRYYVGGLTLFFVFVGGTFVTVDLNFLTKRNGDKEFKDMLRKISSVLLCLIYVPSFFPFFSAFLSIYLVLQLRKTNDDKEIKKIQRQMQICNEHCVIDTYYESCYESFGQATLQLVILLEKPSFTSVSEFVPLLGVLSAWYSISIAPIKIAKALSNLSVRFTEVLAGLANKGVTLLSFAIFIAASRRYFADPMDFNWNLVIATLVPVVVLTIFADLPGILLLNKEMYSKKKKRVRKDLELVMNMISLLLPITAIGFWTVVLYYESEITTARYIVVASIFMFGFAAAFLGFCCEENLPWLGQFDTDILLLIYIGITSYFKGTEFEEMDYQFDSTRVQKSRSPV